MKTFLAAVLVVSLLSTAFAEDDPQKKSIPKFTNEDLEQYYDDPLRDQEIPDILIPPPGVAGAVFKDYSGTVVAVMSYDSEGLLLMHGSGFVARQDGVIVTNNHVITGAGFIKVRLGRRLLAIQGILYTDKENDIAILKTAARSLPTVRIGEPGETEVGDAVYIISSTDGIENSISEGTFSGVRQWGRRQKVLQLNADFATGSSGSPVFNRHGEVIGIATFLIDDEGDGHFAVPIDLIKDKISTINTSAMNVIQSTDYKESVDYWVHRGQHLYKSGKYAEAEKAYKKALQQDRFSAGAYNGLGAVYIALEKFEEALDVLKRAAKLEPDSAWVHSNLGLAYSEVGMYDESLAALRNAIRIIPDLAVAHYNLGLTYRRLKKFEEARTAYEQAVKANPDFADAHLALGITYHDLNDRDAAEREYEILKRLDPKLAQGLGSLLNR